MAFVYTEIARNKRKTWLLIAAFSGIVAGLAYVLTMDSGAPAPVALFAGLGAIIYSLIGYFFGAQVSLAAGGARPITKDQDPRLYRIVENISITAGIPCPKVHIIQDPGLNAFATGRDPEHSSVAVTSGLLKALDDKELEGVIAHEIGHIANYDIRIMMMVVMLVGLISIFADIVIRIGFNGRNRKSHPAVLIIGLIFVVLSPVIANLMQLALSRKRESLADATAVMLTRYPEGLASALEKIKDSSVQMKTANHGMAPLYISNPFRGKNLKSIFSTHPPIDERIKTVREMAV